MDPLRELGKVWLVLGTVLVATGVVFVFGSRLPFRLGRLPGDILIRRENFTFYFPLVSGVLLSVLFSLGLLAVRTLWEWISRK